MFSENVLDELAVELVNGGLTHQHISYAMSDREDREYKPVTVTNSDVVKVADFINRKVA